MQGRTDSWALLSSRFALFSILYHSCPHYHGVVLLKQLWCFHHKHIHLQFWSNKPDNFLFNGAKKNTKMSCMRLVFSHNTGPAQTLPAFKQKSLVCCSKSMAVWGGKAFLQLRAAWKRRWVSFCSRLFNSFRLREASVSSPLHLSLKLESIKGLSGACWEFQCSAKDASGSLSWLEITWPQAALSLSGGRWETGN